MSTDLTSTERELFYQLITAAGTLATVTDNANAVLSEQHQTMTQPQVDAVRAILAKCPVPPSDAIWTGELRDEDLEITKLRTANDPLGSPSGVKVVHLPTGLGIQSESKMTSEENEQVARSALTKKVAEEYKRRG